MGISTKNTGNKGLSKKDKIAQLKTKHDPLFKSLGIQEPHFVPKVFYGSPLVAPFFHSELRVEKDIYTEMVSRDYESEDPTRTLYKWEYNPNWQTDYQTKPFGHSNSPTDVMYLIPLSEFQKIEEPDPDIDFGLMDPDVDVPLKDMTLRDLAAILLQEPVSKRPWLNKIIEEKKKNGKD